MPLIISTRSADYAPSAYWSAPASLADAMAASLGPVEIAISAYANQGRWIVECPDCRGAQIASADDHRFMCNVCANVAVDGLWRPVLWPPEFAAIDELLSARAVVNRNWIPGETLDDLRAEDEAAAIVLADGGIA